MASTTCWSASTIGWRAASARKALRARDRASWRAALAELEIADHFEALDFVTRGLDEAKGQERVGDMRVERDGLVATVEVHSPVEREGSTTSNCVAPPTLRPVDARGAAPSARRASPR